MMWTVGAHDYGKSEIRFFMVDRTKPVHDLREVYASVNFKGNFSAAYSDGDNQEILPTGSMINTVLAMAADYLGRPLEELASFCAERFLESCPAVQVATIIFTETAWERLETEGTADPHGFAEAERANRTVTASAERHGSTTVTAGIANLRLLKSTGSQFTGFHHGEFTNLADVEDRLAAFVIDAAWEYDLGNDGKIDYDACHAAAYTAILKEFSRHRSLSGQHTCYALGTAALKAVSELRRVHIELLGEDTPTVDLQPFGRENPGLLYTVAKNPHGVVHLTVDRTTDPDLRLRIVP
ncbi:factor-independent urate hydroxylase [Streptomyces sp. NPDC127051]|uniref:factor-independent urate hydroxylase n=1 Tax=Streptomyces sp. NPDC127051 TaxID=3347119 RepID=UPI00365E4F4A